MAKVLDSLTLPIKKNGVVSNETIVNNPLSTAGQFSASTAYSVGQYVYYDKKLYRFTSAHAAGAWNASHVTEVTVASELADLKEDTTELKQDYNQLEDNFSNKIGINLFDPSKSHIGRIDQSGVISEGSTTYFTTDNIVVPDGFDVIITFAQTSGGERKMSQASARFITVYNMDGTVNSTETATANSQYCWWKNSTGSDKYIVATLYQVNYDYMIFLASPMTSTISDVVLQFPYRPYVSEIEVQEDVIVPQIEAVDNYVPARRPIISIIIDGDFDYNERMLGVAMSHNMPICFAAPWETDYFSTYTPEQYLLWQSWGNEIAVHGHYNVGQDSPYTEEEIAALVKDAYEQGKALGYDLHGYVCYQGNSVPSTVEEIKKYFDWGASQNNSYGSNKSNIYVNKDTPYTMWRYSMQLSTLAQMKAAVDECKATNGLLWFYGHAVSTNLQYFTLANFIALLSYIEEQGIEVKTPYASLNEYFVPRTDDYAKIDNYEFTVNEAFDVITNNSKYNPITHIYMFDVRLRAKSAISGSSRLNILSGLPSINTRYDLQHSKSGLTAFLYETTYMTSGSYSFSQNEDFYISGMVMYP